MFTRSVCLLFVLSCASVHADGFGIGTPAPTTLLHAWDIDIAADGSGLPPGRGSVSSGARLYGQRCAACHGRDGEGKPEDRLVGGRGTLASDAPIKTIGSYWPYATTLFDYVRRAMPFNTPQSLRDEEVYALVAYLLYLNGLLAEDAVLDAMTLRSVRMPNRDGFTADPRPDAD